MMPLFAFLFFIMFFSVQAVETVTERLWRIEYPYGTKFSNVQFSKTDRFIVARQDGLHCILDAASGAELGRLPLNTDCPEWGLATFIDSDNYILIKSMDKRSIQAYDTKEFKLQYSFEAVDEDIIDFEVSKDETKLVARVGTNKLKIWDLASKQIIKHFELPNRNTEDLSWLYQPHFLPDCQGLFVQVAYRYYLGIDPVSQEKKYATIQNAIIYNLDMDSVGVFPAGITYKWSPSGSKLSYIYDRTNNTFVRMYDWKSKTITDQFEIDAYPKAAYFFTKDESHFVVAYGVNGNICRVYRIADGKNTINYQTGSANGAALSNSGNVLAFANGKEVFAYNYSSTSSVSANFHSDFQINPNPVIDTASISFNLANGGIANISISDAQGAIAKQITTEYLAPGVQNLQLPLNDLANGIYYVTVTCGADTFTSQFLINR